MTESQFLHGLSYGDIWARNCPTWNVQALGWGLLQIVQWARGLLAEVEKTRTVHWVHVKGHSGDGGNDRADELVQWGKEEGPYARLRALGAGEGDSRFGAAIRENSSLGSEKRVDSRGNGVLHRGL